MAINTHTTGIGTLAGIAWTPLDGTGLSPAQRTSVDNDVKAASAMATALLEATKSAFNRDWARFSLNDLADAAGLGAFAYLSRTDLRVSTLATTDDTAADWATFIGRALGSAPATSQARSLGEWRRLAADLQQFAALQASRRDPVTGAAGGITHANGQWYANGQALSLLDLFTAARVNQVANHEDALDDYMIQIQANGRRLAAAREWKAALSQESTYSTYNSGARYYSGETAIYNGREYAATPFHEIGSGSSYYDEKRVKWYIQGAVPTNDTYWDDTGKVAISSAIKTSFMAKWGFDPVAEFHKTPVTFDSGIASDTLQIYSNDIKAYVDNKDADNQALQQKIQQKSNRRDEVLEAMVSFAGKQAKTGSNMAGNLA